MLAAGHLMILGDKRRAIERALYLHKMEILRIVNENLQSHQTAIGIATIGAVACMVLFEVGNFSSIHCIH
jgi:hypothetical protein